MQLAWRPYFRLLPKIYKSTQVNVHLYVQVSILINTSCTYLAYIIAIKHAETASFTLEYIIHDTIFTDNVTHIDYLLIMLYTQANTDKLMLHMQIVLKI